MIDDKTHFLNPEAVLLTGATGFLGTHLLYDLYSFTKAKIYCLIRANTNNGIEKLKISLSKHNHPNFLDNRIIPIIGDLEKPLLGLSKEQFHELSKEIDIIYHNGALVHHIYDYQKLKSANVFSTRELLEFASIDKDKLLIYISTISAILETDKDGLIIEDFPSNHPYGVNGGYNQTKWVSERLLKQASDRNIRIKVFRPALISGHSKTGVCAPQNDHFLNFVKSCIQINCAPKYPFNIDFLPVNFISEIVVKISLYKQTTQNVFNLINPKAISWEEFISIINKMGYPLTLVSIKEWQRKLLSIIDEKNALYSLIPHYLTESSDISSEQNYKIQNNNTIEILKVLGLTWPFINEDLLSTYLDFLYHIGFISPPLSK